MMQIEITGIGSEFQGVGRAEDGRVCFVPGALPGETVEISIAKNAERFMECRLERVITPSPDRAAPDCPYFGQCGGCKAQHVSYETSLALKTQIVEQNIRRIGGLNEVEIRPALGGEHHFRYRNKAEFAIATDRQTGLPFIGQSEAGSHRIVAMDDCLIQHELSVKAAQAIAGWMKKCLVPAWDAGKQGGLRYLVTRVNVHEELMVILCTTGKSVPAVESLRPLLDQATGGRVRSLYQLTLSPRPHHALDGRPRLIAGQPVLEDVLMGLTFSISPQTFFQVNHQMTEALYGEALKAASLTGSETVLDAYCGAGTISLALARQAKRVIGVELNAKAIEDAKENAKRNGLSENTEFIAGDAPEEALKLFNRGLRPDVIVVDPPRKGVEARLLTAMVQCRPERMVYVSCNPSTLARDLKILTESGEYRVDYVQPVDMFSHTEHVESVARLTRI